MKNKNYSLGGNEFKILEYLKENKNNPIAFETICEDCNLSKMCVSHIIRRLEEKKLISRVIGVKTKPSIYFFN